LLEKRLPTIEELNAVAPDTPVFLLHLYDRAILNGAALRAVGYTKNTPQPPGGEIMRDAADTGRIGLTLQQPAIRARRFLSDSIPGIGLPISVNTGPSAGR
jgi:predicted amidohydrolase YtcJ